MVVSAVERSIWIAAPRERVWQEITEPEQIEQWLLPRELGARLKRDSSDKISLLMGEMEIGLAVFEALDPPQQLTSRGLPDRLLATTYTLAEENGGARVTVAMTGFEALPEDARLERQAPSGAAWEMALANLKAFIEGAALPHPQGFVAALFGYRRESKLKLAVERSIWIAAPRERVWQAITDPAQLEQWFSPGTPWRGTGPEVGGRFSVYDAATDSDLYTQVIEAVDPPRRFVTRSAPDPPELPHVTAWILEEENGGTRLTLSFSGYEFDPEGTRQSMMEQNAFGFGMMLENLAAHVEGRSLPAAQGF